MTKRERFPDTLGKMQLLERTRQLLNQTKDAGLKLRQIADDSNGAVPYDWLKRFAIGDIENPGVKYLQALHDHLKTHKPKRPD